MDYLIETNQLTKKFRNHKAVDSVSIHIKKGEIYGFIGRNGAGKTTCMKMLCGLSEPDSGEIKLFGEGETGRYFSRIGSLIEAPGLYPNMNAYENLKMKCICMGIRKEGYIEELIGLVGLTDAGKKHVKKYSLGMKQRLGIAMALAGEPDILILDEPINGLDPQGIIEVRETLLRLNKEKNITIMISSHILEEVSKIADTYGIINNGRLVEEISSEELMEKCTNYIEIKSENIDRITTSLEELNIRKFKVIDKNTLYVYEWLDRVPMLNSRLAKMDCEISSIQLVAEELENYFVKVTGGKENE